MNWIIPANSKIYDHSASFVKNGFIEWRKYGKMNYGDIVYIYQIKPIGKIRFKTLVVNDNIESIDLIDDTEFLINTAPDNVIHKRIYVRLELIKECDTDKLSLEMLKSNGLKSSMQGQIKIHDPNLKSYIEEVFESL